MSRLRAGLLWLDTLDERAFVAVDLALGLFIGVAHGGALALALTGLAPPFVPFAPLLIGSLVLALLVIVSGGIALLAPAKRPPVLRAHAVALSVMATAVLIASAYWVVNGLPSGRFAWTPGILTGICVDPFFLLRRFVLSARSSGSPALADLPIWIGLLAIAAEVGIGVRLALLAGQFAGPPL